MAGRTLENNTELIRYLLRAYGKMGAQSDLAGLVNSLSGIVSVGICSVLRNNIAPIEAFEEVCLMISR